MSWLQDLDRIDPTAVNEYGGKACQLARLHTAQLPVPSGKVLPGSVYRHYVQATGLDEFIRFELGRKPHDQMRWEELWDAALRIRNRFLTTPAPDGFIPQLERELTTTFGEQTLAVRSSAPGEDGAVNSFAGLHDSVLDVSGPDQIIDAIRKVWSSLWSDRALLYRRELNLKPDASSMSVVLMALQPAQAAGILFGRSPANPGQGVIEAVLGQGQGLVDGSIAPDRWMIDRTSGRQIEHQAPSERLASDLRGGRILPTRPAADVPPLQPGQVSALWELGGKLEALYGEPVDCEWCLVDESLQLLQARPLTTAAVAPDDKRPWYLSLHPSRATLEKLCTRITRERLPAMAHQAGEFEDVNLTTHDIKDLVRAVGSRHRAMQEWDEIYHREYIPMAHGIRLFGELYNERMRPADPFAFTRLLTGSGLRALERNQALQQLTTFVQSDPKLRSALATENIPPPDTPAATAWKKFLSEYGDPAWYAGDGALSALLLSLAESPATDIAHKEDNHELEENFLRSFPAAEREEGQALLELGRAAYRLRDDDNIAFGRFLAEVRRARREVKTRLTRGSLTRTERHDLQQLLAETEGSDLRGNPSPPQSTGPLRARQLVGQPAGPGTASGPARVIRCATDLKALRAGEVLVCDAVDPTMTFVVPLAAAIVERRGGMLIHGAIIAREYGLPCVTGIHRVTELVEDGQQLTVDGWLGLIILETESQEENDR